MKSPLVVTLGVMVLMAGPCEAQAADLYKESFEFAGRTRTFHLFAPNSAEAGTAPLIVVLHGSYGRGRDAVTPWMDLARRESVVVAGPDASDRTAWRVRADGPEFIRAVVDEVAHKRAIDRRRIYLFGASGGAVYALTLSMLESTYFAATAVHAGVWRTRQEFIAAQHAARKIPIAIFIGDRDEYFPLFAARKTEDALRAEGHPVQLVVLPGRDHDYRKTAAEVTSRAWDFMKGAELTARIL
jgi:poly(3-hydroxybutyrate) depolymerase